MRVRIRLRPHPSHTHRHNFAFIQISRFQYRVHHKYSFSTGFLVTNIFLPAAQRRMEYCKKHRLELPLASTQNCWLDI